MASRYTACLSQVPAWSSSLFSSVSLSSSAVTKSGNRLQLSRETAILVSGSSKHTYMPSPLTNSFTPIVAVGSGTSHVCASRSGPRPLRNGKGGGGRNSGGDGKTSAISAAWIWMQSVCGGPFLSSGTSTSLAPITIALSWPCCCCPSATGSPRPSATDCSLSAGTSGGLSISSAASVRRSTSLSISMSLPPPPSPSPSASSPSRPS
mmetsp:Transcript_45149/g.127441  ORF Transcript_45149/g.127441 Transcript_45149/m.127441 type:complete len:207 (-) Transcript_45149:984-1604(-)